MTLRAYKYRIYPNKTQGNYLDQVFGSVRFVWNQLVANFNSFSKEGPNRPMNEKILKDNPEYAWLNDSISYALQQKTRDFEETKSQFFNPKRKTKLGRMKFKKRSISNDSFRIPGQKCGNAQIDLEAGTIKLPKMQPMKVVFDRPFKGEVRSITVSRNKANQYFVSILVQEEVELKQNTGRSIGIDLGLKHLAVLSNGIKVETPRFFRENQAKLKRAQQHLSRKVKGSNRYLKQKLKVARLHNDITNQRKHHTHVLSSWIVENFDHIFMENLNVAGMKKNRSLAKSISDASFGELTRQIEYKSNWYGRSFQKIDRWFPSSKTCHSCGYKMESMELSIRDWICPRCGEIHDRDINAAKNILVQGYKELYDLSHEEALEQSNKSAESVDYKHGESRRPSSSLLDTKASLDEVLSEFYYF